MGATLENGVLIQLYANRRGVLSSMTCLQKDSQVTPLHTTRSINENLDTTDNRASRLSKEESHISHIRGLHETPNRDRLTLGLDNFRRHRPIRDARKLVEERRVARSRADRVEPQLVPGELHRHGLGRRGHAGLCGVIPRLQGAGPDRVFAGDDDGRARPVLFHLGDEDLGGEEDALDIYLEGAVELFEGDVDARLVGVGPASVVDDDRGRFAEALN